MTGRLIFSTAPLRGPGLDALRALGEVVLDPWIDHRPLRLYSAEQLAERAAELGASVLICEADQCSGPVLELPLEAIGSTRGDPTNVDVAGATAKGIPVLRAPGRNADGVAELTVGLLLAVTRDLLAADRDVRDGRGVPRRLHPLSALPGVAAGRPHRRARGPRRRGPGHPVAPRGARHARHRQRPLRPRRHPRPRRPARRGRRGVDARGRHPRHARPDLRRAGGPHEGRARSTSTRPVPASTTSTH